MVDYFKEALEMLENYPKILVNIFNIENDIRDMYGTGGLKAVDYSRERVQGSGSGENPLLIEAINKAQAYLDKEYHKEQKILSAMGLLKGKMRTLIELRFLTYACLDCLEKDNYEKQDPILLNIDKKYIQECQCGSKNFGWLTALEVQIIMGISSATYYRTLNNAINEIGPVLIYEKNVVNM